eukprot:TRINITY_DN10243_c0_g1_i2.p1 TRINITY_DN10243_c0_g1~~TRINITY_DN10243_c0_g1_i2.p1  ORF type:complete len:923 (-),score=216.37 TRINITY_DN10243_c0_g1_i2:139-2907(-)
MDRVSPKEGQPLEREQSSRSVRRGMENHDGIENGDPLARASSTLSPIRNASGEKENSPKATRGMRQSVGELQRLEAENRVEQEQEQVDEEQLELFQEDGRKKAEEKAVKTEGYADKLLNNTVYIIVINFFTFWTLFADDIVQASFSVEVDFPLDIISLIIFVTFSVDIIAGNIAKPEYRLSFYFFLDVVSTLSLLLDINFIMDAVIDTSSSTVSGAKNTTQLAKAGRITRVGTRAARVIRVIRLIRIAKLFKTIEDTKKKKEQQQVQLRRMQQRGQSFRVPSAMLSPSSKILPITDLQVEKPPITMQNNYLPLEIKANGDENHQWKNDTPFQDVSPAAEEEEFTEMKESNVSRELSDRTTKKVIIIVLLTLLVVPMCSSDYWNDPPPSYSYAATFIDKMFNQTNDNGTLSRLFKLTIDSMEGKCLYLGPSNAPSNYTFGTSDTSYLRSSVEYSVNSEGSSAIIYDTRDDSKLNALLNIGKTIFICVVLVATSMSFSNDANKIVIFPLERTIERVKKIAKNPLISREQEMTVAKEDDKNSEVVIIEQSIMKIATLLALGFGDAGSNIIATNMARGGDLDPMLPGQRKFAIFGFCDIRQFTDATEILQKDVMVFVNSIAEIVHAAVDRFAGSANKNIGDAFLLVWKIPETEEERNADGHQGLRNTRTVRNLADLSLIAFMKIWAQINRSPVLNTYRSKPELIKRLPNYRVKMGFGLHIGWAIEGAIGSEFKIDASYLSPNVNMASRLEAATKQFGVPILISSALYNFFSSTTKEKCRQIDYVTVKGSLQPIGLFTVDMDISKLELKKVKNISKKEKKRKQIHKKKTLLEKIKNGQTEANVLFSIDKDLRKMLDCVGQSEEFRKCFQEAFDHYLTGNWSSCKTMLDQCLNIHNEDHPTKAIHDVLREHDFICPADWPGYRVLTEK